MSIRSPRIVDVGGGQGVFLAAILAKHPGTEGVLFDQAQVVALAEPVFFHLPRRTRLGQRG